ncbi:hypothetical protein [Nannocystis punicea]|uniref:Secreted protein n=1 Tax=Nannocystis punicea TaxID=2995304 RepID=A0ABY7H6W7_9BACT|nr:hypothetical protein [Nannocystis poenicansa]WAS94893.1 hypothetical protein O0S08_01920 [Nannocystis poenicansa]
MRSIRSFSLVAIALSFGAVAFGARTAEAAICCGAPVCQSDNPPALCNWCTPTCVEDEEPVAGEIVYDEVESLCYVAGTL